MTLGILLLEFALLGFVAALYYLARRNLTAAAMQERAEIAESLREVQETVAGLISVLQKEAAEIEARLDDRARQIEALTAEIERPTQASEREFPSGEPRTGIAPMPPQTTSSPKTVSAIDRALQLIARGETPLSAARQTALTVTEVEMAARMRGLGQ